MPKPEGLSNGTTSSKRIAKGQPSNYFRGTPFRKTWRNGSPRLFLLVFVFAVVVYLVVHNIGVFGYVLLAIVGIGAVVLVHEFGHFVVAKLSGIKVEAFSIGFPPALAGISRTQKGYRIRILPGFFPTEEDSESDGSLLTFTIGKKVEDSETEYRIGLIPFGGFVKMLGQEDTKAVKPSDDPRSYANKPVGTRMAVIAAGVTFNVLSAIVVFMIVFLIGIYQIPPVVGGVKPNSPAARAGLKAGDEIIEIAGKSDNLSFSNIAMAAVFSKRGEKITLKVRHEDGSLEDYELVAEEMDSPMGERLRLFGIANPQSLTIAELSKADANDLNQKTGLLPGDRIKAINGKDVQTHWQFDKIARDAFMPRVTILAERPEAVSKKSVLVESQIKLTLSLEEDQAEPKAGSYDIYSMVPRLEIIDAKNSDAEPPLASGDIVIEIGNVENPTYDQMREIITEHEDKKLPIRVLRKVSNESESVLSVTVVPKRVSDSNQVLIGINIVPDLEHAVVADTISTKAGTERLAIPRGAVITAVDGIEVSSFYDIAREISKYPGERITIDWRIDEEVAGDVVLDVSAQEDSVGVRCIFADYIPFKPLERLYKATGPIDAIVMGCRTTLMFIANAYMTLKSWVSGLVSAKNFMGPVGIATISYRLVKDYPPIQYVYFLGLVSAFIAVFNLLPLLPFDGGHLVFLLVEKIKGSPVNERIQGIILYIGLVLVFAFALYVTFNDIVRNWFTG